MDFGKDSAEYVAAKKKLEEGVRAIVENYDRHRRRLLTEDLIHLDRDVVAESREEAVVELIRNLADYTEDDIWVLIEVLDIIALIAGER